MSKLYTLDCDGDFICEGADIIRISDAALTRETERFNADSHNSGLRITGWKIGRFGDCWLKFRTRPTKSTHDGISCHVQIPGQHPGGRAWWFTPIRDVWIPIYEEV